TGQGCDGHKFCGLPGSSGDRADTTLERGNAFFECCNGWVGDAGVDVAILLQGKEVCCILLSFKHIRCRLINRYGARAVNSVGHRPGVEGTCAEPKFVICHNILSKNSSCASIPGRTQRGSIRAN